jgi:hypothetical protein
MKDVHEGPSAARNQISGFEYHGIAIRESWRDLGHHHWLSKAGIQKSELRSAPGSKIRRMISTSRIAGEGADQVEQLLLLSGGCQGMACSDP